VPTLRVSDLESSVRFYTGPLGFGIVWRSPGDGGGENCMLESGHVALLLTTEAHPGDPPRFTGTLYFDTDGVDELWVALKDRVEVAWPLSGMDYGTREFGIRDPDGYVLAFAEQREPR
jgi:catechol 2,3-dioxygenase-like lactoylglutathione lyase family enzyme